MTGRFTEFGNFDPPNSSFVQSAGSGDLFTTKYTVRSISTHTQDFLDAFDIKIGPNPTRGILRVQLLDQADSPMTLEVFDSQGKRINSHSLTDRLNLDLSDYPKGLYILKFEKAGQIGAYHILKQ